MGIRKAEEGFTIQIGGSPVVFPPLGFDLEPPDEIICDKFVFENVGIPYQKFPQNPGG